MHIRFGSLSPAKGLVALIPCVLSESDAKIRLHFHWRWFAWR
jgi:hypothetical protein